YPVPAVMVSCKKPGERSNIITVAWAGTVCSDPAMVSISVRPERYSHDIIEETGEFVINLVTERLTRPCDWCGVRSGSEYDKFREMKLTEYVSEFMDTPAIAESPVNIYCKVIKTEHLGSHDMFIGEVKGVTVDDSFMDDKGRFALEECGLITYSHGEYYALGRKLGKFGYSVKKSPVKPVNKKRSKSKPAKEIKNIQYKRTTKSKIEERDHAWTGT
ncbi:MAG: flavin reductase family protein, partial [Lachnospiraceae bacterium]|nr:flavin reductase family protein [Lachnospiraceae bacterium]